MSANLPVTVTAPASSGNLGPGFDVLAMALDLRNRVTVTRGTGTVTISGHGADTLPTDEHNLVAQAFARGAGTMLAAAGVDLHCENAIPLARGLGSSTAATACGLIAGWEFAGTEWSDDELFAALAEWDGHPDNAAACAYGGVVLCRTTSDGPDVIPFGPIDWLSMLAVVPDRELATSASRAALPGSYDRATVVQAIAATGLLVGGLLGGHPELVEDALHADVLHEPHRAELVPELAEVREALVDTAALGATLSGAGPTVLVWLEPADVEQAVGSLGIDFPEWQLLSLACTPDGAGLTP